MESSPDLPKWLNNTLVTLPPDHVVRCLTLPPDRPVRRDHIGWNSETSEEESVFAFQVPADGHHPVNHTEVEGQPGTDVATRFAHVGCAGAEFMGTCPSASQVSTVPFSTPGPGWAVRQASVSCSPV